ncbi:MAG TPA: hypothetical protein VH061_02560 [Solirubrobacteraceae bacterium]|jgi:hypothetical protein|nr:hypothetical protein [Solirubrobacteraceae bacterium]
MRRRYIAALVAVLLGVGIFGASVAHAAYKHQFMAHTFLELGQNDFDESYYDMIDVEGGSTGVAASCVGVSGTEHKVCGGEGEYISTGYLGFGGTGYLHNHSTWNSYFNAYVYRGP